MPWSDNKGAMRNSKCAFSVLIARTKVMSSRIRSANAAGTERAGTPLNKSLPAKFRANSWWNSQGQLTKYYL